MSTDIAPFEPTRLQVVDLDEPLPPIAPEGADGRWHTRAQLMIRLAGRPIDRVAVPIDIGMSPGQLADVIWAASSVAIRSAAADAGFDPVDHLPPGGLGSTRPSPTNHSISVVIATHDRPASLARCLMSMARLRHPDLEIIVVDNAPADDRAERIVRRATATDPRVRYVREDRAGLATAHNAALRVAGGDIVAFTDDDVLVDEHWAAALDRAFDVVDDVACVTGLILPAEIETPAQQWIDSGFGFDKGLTRRIFDLETHRPDDRLFPYTAGSVGSGANMAFTRAFLDTSSGFDEALGAGTLARGGDDLAAFHDVLQAGHRLVYEPAAMVHHFHHTDTAVVRKAAFSYGVALSAYLTRTVAEQPRSAGAMLTRLPAGVRHGLRSTKAPIGPAVDGLQGASWRRRAGVLFGPVAYARSRRRCRIETAGSAS